MKLIAATAAVALVSACAGPPALTVGPDPGDPGATALPLRYAPVAADSAGDMPVEPKPWAEQNRGVAPSRRSAP
jgi:hypothetical protein